MDKSFDDNFEFTSPKVLEPPSAFRISNRRKFKNFFVFNKSPHLENFKHYIADYNNLINLSVDCILNNPHDILNLISFLNPVKDKIENLTIRFINLNPSHLISPKERLIFNNVINLKVYYVNDKREHFELCLNWLITPKLISVKTNNETVIECMLKCRNCKNISAIIGDLGSTKIFHLKDNNGNLDFFSQDCFTGNLTEILRDKNFLFSTVDFSNIPYFTPSQLNSKHFIIDQSIALEKHIPVCEVTESITLDLVHSYNRINLYSVLKKIIRRFVNLKKILIRAEAFLPDKI